MEPAEYATNTYPMLDLDAQRLDAKQTLYLRKLERGIPPLPRIRDLVRGPNVAMVCPCHLVREFSLLQREAYDLLEALEAEGSFRAVAISDLLELRELTKEAGESERLRTLEPYERHLSLAFVHRTKPVPREPITEYVALTRVVQGLFEALVGREARYRVGVPLGLQGAARPVRVALSRALTLLGVIGLDPEGVLRLTRLSHSSALMLMGHLLGVIDWRQLIYFVVSPAGFLVAARSEAEEDGALGKSHVLSRAFEAAGFPPLPFLDWLPEVQKPRLRPDDAKHLDDWAADDRVTDAKRRPFQDLPVHVRRVVELSSSRFVGLGSGFPTDVRITEIDCSVRELAGARAWQSVLTADLKRLDLDDAALGELAETLDAPELRWLELSGNRHVTQGGVEAIARAVGTGKLPELAWLGLIGTQCQASPYVDGTRWRIAPEARMLAETYGYQRWMMLGSRRPECEAVEELPEDQLRVVPSRFSDFGSSRNPLDRSPSESESSSSV